MHIDECCSLCDALQGCEGFAYAHGSCYLKKDFVGTYPNPGVVSRVRSPGKCSDFGEGVEGKDLTGRLLEDWVAPTQELCCQACGRKLDCQGFVFFEERCYLKAEVTGVYDSPGRMSYMKQGVLAPTGAPTTVTCSAFEAEIVDSDMSGTLLKQEPVMHIDECCSLCDALQGCEGFAYAHGSCYLKKDFVGTYPNPGVVSRVRSPGKCSDFGEGVEGKDLIGRLLEDWEAPTPELCCQACGRKLDCQGFVFFEERCYLKAEVTGVYDAPGRVSHVKEGLLAGGPLRRLAVSPSVQIMHV